jgi:HSP20 family protein
MFGTRLSERGLTMAEASTVPVKSGNRQIRRRDPFEMLEALQDEMARFWSQGWPFGSLAFPRRMGQLFQPPDMWTPRVDVFEQDGDLVVKAELPGAKKEEIEVTLDRSDLVIRGERKAESEVKEESYYRMERSYGSFYRRLPLGFEAAAEHIKATFADGVLEIRVPKPAETPPEAKKITIA